MSGSTWKGFERRIAAALGTTRISAAANSQREDWGRDAPDAMTDIVACQVKKGYSPPSYLTGWLKGIVESAARFGRIGVVVWAGKGQRDDDAYVIMRFADFARLHRALLPVPASSGSEQVGSLADAPPETSVPA